MRLLRTNALAVTAYLNVPVYRRFHQWLGRGDVFKDMWEHWKAGDRKAASRIANQIETTTLKDIAAVESDLGTLGIKVIPDAEKMAQKDISIDDVATAVGSVRRITTKVLEGKKPAIEVTLAVRSFQVCIARNTLRTITLTPASAVRTPSDGMTVTARASVGCFRSASHS